MDLLPYDRRCAGWWKFSK